MNIRYVWYYQCCFLWLNSRNLPPSLYSRNLSKTEEFTIHPQSIIFCIKIPLTLKRNVKGLLSKYSYTNTSYNASNMYGKSMVYIIWSFHFTLSLSKEILYFSYRKKIIINDFYVIYCLVDTKHITVYSIQYTA